MGADSDWGWERVESIGKKYTWTQSRTFGRDRSLICTPVPSFLKAGLLSRTSLELWGQTKSTSVLDQHDYRRQQLLHAEDAPENNKPPEVDEVEDNKDNKMNLLKDACEIEVNEKEIRLFSSTLKTSATVAGVEQESLAIVNPWRSGELKVKFQKKQNQLVITPPSCC